MTPDEYETQLARLDNDIKAAYAAFNQARDHWDALRLERRRLTWQWQEQLKTQQPETVHACPPDGSGLTPCCGRTPFELPLTDRISSETPTTCPAAVAQPGKET